MTPEIVFIQSVLIVLIEYFNNQYFLESDEE